ncbi:hypothetical protein HNY73_015032 [Argiope bruennichi]|uniref:Uncharacterized protein n=2 Tax=Argiope bruennichi TaxID=94029 RepID=A0A8T0ES86_ARGBR|nr:hypothetical protein HNY73_015032 [Argiope bruennichi]
MNTCTMPVGFYMLLFLIVASIPAVYTAHAISVENDMDTGENSEASFHLDGMHPGNVNKLNEPHVVPSLVPEVGLERQKRADKKQCHILVQRSEMQEGTCTTLADSTPACHNEQYLAINFNEC